MRAEPAATFERVRAVPYRMRAVPDQCFADAFGQLDRSDRLALLEVLWTERGWTVDRDRNLLVARRGEESKRIRVGSAPSIDDDILVTIDRSRVHLDEHTDVAVWGPSKVRDLLLYGIDREVAEKVYEAIFERSLYYEESTLEPSPRLLDRVPVFKTMAVVILLLAAVAAAAGVPLSISDSTPEFDRNTEFDGSDRFGNGTNDSQTNTAEREETQSAYPPGINDEGIDDIDAVREAHLNAVMGSSYTFAIRESGPRNHTTYPGAVTHRLDGTINNRTSYEMRQRLEYPPGEDRANRTLNLYANGENRYGQWTYDNQTTFENSTFRGTDDTEAVTRMMANAIVRYLDTNETRVERDDVFGRQAFVVRATGDPSKIDEEVQNYQALAVIRPDGTVDLLQVLYTPVGTNETARYDMQLFAWSGTIDEPQWYETARQTNETTTTVESLTSRRGLGEDNYISPTRTASTYNWTNLDRSSTAHRFF